MAERHLIHSTLERLQGSVPEELQAYPHFDVWRPEEAVLIVLRWVLKVSQKNIFSTLGGRPNWRYWGMLSDLAKLLPLLGAETSYPAPIVLMEFLLLLS